jgi:cobalt-precorrin 5A hydrolase
VNDEPVALVQEAAAPTGGAATPTAAAARCRPTAVFAASRTWTSPLRRRAVDQPPAAARAGAPLAGKRVIYRRRWRHEPAGPPPSASAATAARRPPPSCGRWWRPSAAAAPLADVAAVASIDLKADEPGLLNWPLAGLDDPLLPRHRAGHRAGAPPIRDRPQIHRHALGLRGRRAARGRRRHDPADRRKLKYRGPDGRNATVSIARIPQRATATRPAAGSCWSASAPAATPTSPPAPAPPSPKPTPSSATSPTSAWWPTCSTARKSSRSR